MAHMLKRTLIKPLLAMLLAIPAPASAREPAALADLAFLEGAWRSGDGDFVFEEIWSGAEGGVMTAMARGVSGGNLQVLEYIVVAEEPDGVVMRFKHYNDDFTTWEADAPISLSLEAVAENDVTFIAGPASQEVKSIRYWMPEAGTLQADIVLLENGEEGGFSLTFARMSE